jgi:hypothetical protein
MKFISPFLRGCLLSLLSLSPFWAFAGGSDGGGNLINGRMAESYISNPLQQGRAGLMVRKKIASLAAVDRDLAALVSRGIDGATWYFVPSPILELPSEVTGVLTVSVQGAAQNFDTKEIWIDTRSFARMADDSERAKLIIHEALMSAFAKIEGFSGIPKLTRSVRLMTSLVFKPQLSSLSPDEIFKAIQQAELKNPFLSFSLVELVEKNRDDQPTPINDRVQIYCGIKELGGGEGNYLKTRCSDSQ